MTERKNNDVYVVNRTISERFSSLTIMDHFAFLFYCFLLCVPAYAIIRSAINQDWLMMVIDALFVPVGFVHGVLILLGAT